MPLIEIKKKVPKVWGKELWLVNCRKYCGKLLMLNKGSVSSYHYHMVKQETFYCLKGLVKLVIGEIEYQLTPDNSPITILPKEKHKFEGVTDAVILEVSTMHRDDDVVRLTESHA